MDGVIILPQDFRWASVKEKDHTRILKLTSPFPPLHRLDRQRVGFHVQPPPPGAQSSSPTRLSRSASHAARNSSRVPPSSTLPHFRRRQEPSLPLQPACPICISRRKEQQAHLLPPRQLVSEPSALKMAPPFGFSNDLARWVGKGCVSGVVSCEFVPDPVSVKAKWDAIDPLSMADEEGNAQRMEDSKKSLFATGFLVHSDDYGIFVLTCAHALGPVFNAENQLTAVQARGLYEPHIVCDHNEQSFRDGLHERRRFATGTICQVNCAKDLLLISIPRYYFEVLYCKCSHTIFTIAQNFPAPLKTVVMVSWPLLRNRTMVLGHISHKGRHHSDLAQDNPQNFQMLLSEVNIGSDSGSSGAPLVDGNVEVVGILHGGHGSFSYFISLADVRATLAEWGVIGNED